MSKSPTLPSMVSADCAQESCAVIRKECSGIQITDRRVVGEVAVGLRAPDP